MFIGEYEHTIDEKGRVSVPVKFRDSLAVGAVLTRGLDGCLWLYPKEEWMAVAEEIAKLPITQKNARSFSRFILSGAVEVKPDKAGRINIPKYLQSYANITDKVVAAGMSDHLELWSAKSWNDFKTEMEASSEEVAEKLTEFGF